MIKKRFHAVQTRFVFSGTFRVKAEKAAKAFCFCKCGVGPCIMKQVGRDECKDLREFKQKLME